MKLNAKMTSERASRTAQKSGNERIDTEITYKNKVIARLSIVLINRGTKYERALINLVEFKD